MLRWTGGTRTRSDVASANGAGGGGGGLRRPLFPAHHQQPSSGAVVQLPDGVAATRKRRPWAHHHGAWKRHDDGTPRTTSIEPAVASSADIASLAWAVRSPPTEQGHLQHRHRRRHCQGSTVVGVDSNHNGTASRPISMQGDVLPAADVTRYRPSWQRATMDEVRSQHPLGKQTLVVAAARPREHGGMLQSAGRARGPTTGTADPMHLASNDNRDSCGWGGVSLSPLGPAAHRCQGEGSAHVLESDDGAEPQMPRPQLGDGCFKEWVEPTTPCHVAAFPIASPSWVCPALVVSGYPQTRSPSPCGEIGGYTQAPQWATSVGNGLPSAITAQTLPPPPALLWSRGGAEDEAGGSASSYGWQFHVDPIATAVSPGAATGMFPPWWLCAAMPVGVPEGFVRASTNGASFWTEGGAVVNDGWLHATLPTQQSARGTLLAYGRDHEPSCMEEVS